MPYDNNGANKREEEREGEEIAEGEACTLRLDEQDPLSQNTEARSHRRPKGPVSYACTEILSDAMITGVEPDIRSRDAGYDVSGF